MDDLLAPTPGQDDLLEPAAPDLNLETPHRKFGDADAMRSAIFDNVLEAAKAKYPIENSKHQLHLENLHYTQTKPYTLAEQKKAILSGRSLTNPLYGDWVLKDKFTGGELDRRPGLIAHVPYATHRGTFIDNGSEYTISHQSRLKPGVYVRQKDNGILEAHFNTKQGTGPSFKIHMEPDTGIFRLNVGQSNLKLYPILRSMGVPDSDIAAHWGEELLKKNIEAEDPRAVSRAFAKLVHSRADKAVSEDNKQDTVDQIVKDAAADDRKWTYLWFTGKLKINEHKGEPWVLVDTHRGLCESAYASVKSEGIECEQHFQNPHISVMRPEECSELKKKFGLKWHGAAKEGMQIRFRLTRIVSLIPQGWPEMERVWFIECESPELEKYRKDLGFPALPVSKAGKEMRFHITFGVRKRPDHRAFDEFRRITKRAAAEEMKPAPVETPAPLDHGAAIRGVFEKMELDPEVTSSTLGAPHTNVSIPTMLRASQKLLNVQKGTEDVDDRDSLAYQTFHGPEDFFAERIRKDAGQAARKLLWKSTLRGNMKHIPAGALTPQLRSVLIKSGLGSTLEEVNPFEIHDANLRVLRIGEGGIPDDAVPDSARALQPSHFGFLDPVRSPESSNIGVDSRLAEGTVKGRDGRLYTKLLNFKTGKPQLVSAEQAAKSIVAFPGEMEKEGDTVRAMDKARQVVYVPKKSVDYVLPHTSNMFTSSVNLIPLVSGIKGGRALMGGKYPTQALPLRNPEAPLVQNQSEDGRSFHEIFGEKVGAVRAKGQGVVTKVDKDSMTVKYADGTTETKELYHNFPFNRKTFLHNTPMVGVGDKVAPGQLLAKSNYTDDRGHMALGTNLRTGYMAYKGLNYEDAIAISESAAKKLSSEHMYQHALEPDEGTEIGRKEFMSIFPTKFTRDQFKTIDDNGVVKVGTKVKHGDPLVLSLNKNQNTAVHRGHRPMYGDGALTWKHESDGEVTDVEKTRDGGWNVTVKAYSPMQEGDKIGASFGDKGIVAKIIPDHEMPHTAEGKPMEVLLNPLGIISRGNPSQMYEAWLGKIARKEGKPRVLPSFHGEHLHEYVERELKKAGLTPEEDLIDPTTGQKIPGVATGERFLMKLHHTAESKGKGRDLGGYTAEGIPAKGGDEGSKRLGGMELVSVLAHGANAVARDAKIVRGQKNDEYWRAFRLGNTPSAPKQPFIYNKFLSHLKGAGVNVEKRGDKLHLKTMNDRDVEALSSGAINSGETVRGSDLKPIDGGLFDERLTGGHGGTKWSHIQLHEPMPSPIAEEPIRRILGLTQKNYEDVIAGRKEIGGQTGGKGIQTMLSKLNLEDEINRYEGLVRSGAKSKRDNAVKVLGVLKTLARDGGRPEDWVITKAPVLPPSMRPITQMRGMQMSADPNYLYRDLIHANNDLREVSGIVDPTQAADERLRTYNALKAVTGLGDPVQAKTQEKNVQGLLAHVFGKGAPKGGQFQRRVLGSSVDTVGRATISPNPDLHMDQVGLPEQKAWTIYRPFIIRRLIRQGMPAQEAAKAVASQSPVAKKSMLAEMGERPVMINRAPSLHKYNFMAAWPVLSQSKTLQIPPVVTPGFGADFDGDTMNYHVPVDDEAVKDAIEKMMPSRNLKSVRDFKVHYLPRNEFLMGLHLASAAKNKKEPRIFHSKQDVISAYKRGEIHAGDPVQIQD